MNTRLLVLVAAIVLSLIGGLMSAAPYVELATFGRLLLVSCVVIGGLVVLLDRAERDR